MSPTVLFVIFVVVWVSVWIGSGVYFKKQNQSQPFCRGFLVGLFVILPVMYGIQYLFPSHEEILKQTQDAEKQNNTSKVQTLASLVPYSKSNQGNIDFIQNYIPQIEKQCPGLIKYKDDWEFEEVTNVGFTIRVSDKPINRNLWEYRSPGNRCFFDLSDDNEKIFIPKRACASLCKDALIDDSSFKIAVNAVRGKNDSSYLTQQERNAIIGSLGAMMVWIGKKEENVVIIDKIMNGKNHEETDKYLLTQYLSAKSEIENKALAGDYQSQRNIAYIYSTDSSKIGGNKIAGCAWYLILFASGDSKVDPNLDKKNIDVFCGNEYLTVAERDEAFDIARKGAELIYKSTYRFDKVYSSN